jgi:aspartate/methionine/tyrosine aminotransferase
MPRFPSSSPHVALLKGAIFAPPPATMAPTGEFYPLNVGDTWMDPAIGTRMEDLRTVDWPGLHQYAPTQGRPELLAAIAARVSARSGLPVEVSNVLVTASGTIAWSAIVATIMDPGEEIIILAPNWPLAAGAIRTCKGTPRQVPFMGVHDPETAIALVAPHLTERTVALYFNTPNNPTGAVLTRPVLKALVSWAAKNDLWVIADDAYEDYQYQGQHVAARTFAPDRTISLHSFTKAYGMAGNRVGYLVGPSEIIAAIHKVTTHVYYAAPTAGQIAALRVLGPLGDDWVAAARRTYRDIAHRCASILGIPPPEGGAFLFPDIGDDLERNFPDSGLQGLMRRCAERRLYVTPGTSFGPYPTHIRVSFISAPPEVVERGVRILAEVLGR